MQQHLLDLTFLPYLLQAFTPSPLALRAVVIALTIPPSFLHYLPVDRHWALLRPTQLNQVLLSVDLFPVLLQMKLQN